MSLSSLIRRAAKEAGVPVAVILGSSRMGPVARARHRAMAEAWSAGWSKRRISRAFARDRSTVLYAVRKRLAGEL